MNIQQSKNEKVLLAILTMAGWFALIAQFYIIINSHAASSLELTVRFFSYFTILTNITVAACVSVLLFRQNSKEYIFFSNQKTLTAITVYIIIVGVIYNIILRFLWSPTGLQKLVDELLHSVIPSLFFIYWLVFVLKDRLKWNDFLPWLIYPLVYVFYVLIRGSFSGFYPYPFIDLDQLGWKNVIINSIGMAGAFMVVSILFIGIGKYLNRKNK